MSRKIKTSVFVATSLDGFIARIDGSLDWLDKANLLVPAGEDCGFKAFMSSVDALVMGRKTFEQVLTFGDWPYGTKKIFVLSTAQVDIPASIKDTVESTRKSPTELLAELEMSGKKHVYIDGGATIQSFFREKLIDEMTITMVPVILGEGIPLFGRLNSDKLLIHKKTNTESI